MPDFLQFGFMQRAFAAGAVMAVVCPLIGVFLVPRRLSLIDDTLAHVALAGVALGLLVGASPALGALVVTVAGALGMERLRSRGALQGDAALAVFLSGGFALAVVLISLARGFNADLFAILFGSILTISPADVWLILALGAVVVTTILLSYRRLFAITLHEDLARTSGVPVTALNLMLTVLTALTTVVAMRMVGVLLVSAMIVIPTLTGFALGRSFRRATAVAIAMALASVGIGLTAAYYLGLAAGGAVVLTALLLFALAALARRVPWGPRARLAAITLLCLSLTAGASAQDGECKRWRAAFATMPVRMVTVQMGAKTVAIRVKVAETSEQAAAGFQCSTSQEIQNTLILFDFGREIHTQFHMQNVPAALDIAFVKADGNIFSILKMDPSPTALYGPMGNFRFALEARAGFYESQGVRQGEARLLVPAAK
jgi:zinc transport system permease protein